MAIVAKTGFPAEQIVEDEGAAHERSPEKDISRIVRRVRKDRRRCAEENHDAFRKDQTCCRQQRSGADCHDKCRRSELIRLLLPAFAESTRDQASRAHSDHEPEGLNDRHHRKDDADRSSGAGSEPCHEKRIRHVVNGCDQHRENRRDGEGDDQARYRSLRHFLELPLSGTFILHEILLLLTLKFGGLPDVPPFGRVCGLRQCFFSHFRCNDPDFCFPGVFHDFED